MKHKRILIAHDNQNDLDDNKHDFIMYKYKNYIFRKEWYVNMEDKYVMGLTLYKKGAKNKYCQPFEYDGAWYNEIFHSGNCHEDDSDEQIIELVETIINKHIKEKI